MKSRFDRFTVDSATRQLLREGEEIHVSRKAFDALCVLIARHPDVVTKEELFRHIWPDTFVSDANLNVLIGEIRRALGDSPQTPRFIRTAHGVGYAFCGKPVNLDRATPSAGDGAMRAWLVSEERTFALSDGDNVIGRDSQCAIWLDDAGVSRRHARLHLSVQAGTATLEDLQSTNGTFVGRRRLKSETPLADGDEIRVGPVRLEFRFAQGEQPPTKRIRRR